MDSEKITDMIFTARQLQETCQEQNMDLYMTFVDLTKAFDTVSREGLWKIMAKFGSPVKFIAMVRQFHDGMLAWVQNDSEFSDPFPMTNSVKQGCVLATALFSMVTAAFQGGDNGGHIRYRFDGKLFNLRRLQAKSKVQTKVLDEFLFADDMAKDAPAEEKMQNGVDQPSKHVYVGPIWAESGRLSHSSPIWAPYRLFCPYKTHICPILVKFL